MDSATMKVQIPTKVSSDISEFCMNLLLMDNILTSRDKFKEFCSSIFLMMDYVQYLRHMFSMSWHLNMPPKDTKYAAKCCLVISEHFSNCLTYLGQQGRAVLSQKVNDKNTGFPYCAQMVWAYVDWKLVHETNNERHKHKNVSPFDDVFTAENIAKNEILRLAVLIGMEVMSIMESKRES